MRGLLAVGALGCLLSVGLGGAAAAAEPTATIETVEIAAGRAEVMLTATQLPPEHSLSTATVRVTLDGRQVDAELEPQDRAETRAKGAGAAAVLVVDVSGSMAGNMYAARQAAAEYLNSLPTGTQVGLVAFSERPRLVVAPTSDLRAVATALKGLRATGSTALHDAVALGARTLANLGPASQRRLAVLSDGIDTTSANSLTAATTALANHDVAVDAVAFRYGDGDTSALRRLAKVNGGRVLVAADDTQLAAAFGDIARRYTERAILTVDVPRDFAGRSVTLAVNVVTSDGTFNASRVVTFPAGIGWWFTWLPDWSPQVWLLGVFSFGAVLLAGLLFVGVGKREDTGARVLRQLERYGRDASAMAPGRPAEHGFTRAALNITEQVLRSRGWEEKLAERLDLAGVPLKPAEWTLLRICGSVVLTGLLLLLGLNFFIALGLGVLVGWVGTHLFATIRVSRRRAAFADQLPDVLQLVAGSLRAGFSLPQSLDSVVRENTQPSAGEISRALAETRIGVPLEDALDRIAYRMDSDDLKWIVMAIRIQREVGGNLAEVLLNTVKTMRDRAETRRQVRTLSAEGRLSAYVLLGLPFAIAGYMLLVRGEYLRPLYTTPLGLLLIGVAAVFMALGSFWMSRLVKVEV